jgi:hypothetical protein
MPQQLLDPWKSFFDEIDVALHQEVTFQCLGGFVAKVQYDLARDTSDVDVLPIATNKEIDAVINKATQYASLHKKYGVYLQVVGVVMLPEDYESRLVEMFPGAFKHLRLLALDPYDLALSKIERNSQRDRDDVKHLARVVPFDLEVLRKRFEDELRPNLAIPEREALTLRLWIDAINEERSQSFG